MLLKRHARSSKYSASLPTSDSHSRASGVSGIANSIKEGSCCLQGTPLDLLTSSNPILYLSLLLYSSLHVAPSDVSLPLPSGFHRHPVQQLHSALSLLLLPLILFLPGVLSFTLLTGAGGLRVQPGQGSDIQQGSPVRERCDQLTQ